MEMAKKETMTSRERVIKAINHQEADRVPIDLGGFQTGIHKNAYKDLLDYLGLEEEIVILDPVQQLAKPSEEVLKRFKIDTRYICAHGPDSFKGGIEKNERNGRLWHDLKDEFGVVWSMPDDQNLFMDISHHPLADATIEDVANYPFPKGNDPTRFSGIREEALRMREETPYALCTGIHGVVYEYCWYMRGLEQWLMDTILNPEFCEAVLDKMAEFWIDFCTGFMGAIGDIVDVVMIGDDLAGQSGPLFRADFYKGVVKPRQKKLAQHIRSLTDAKIWYHTCGNCKSLIDDLADNGVDILNPVQTSAEGMDPQGLKDEFGKKMVFWGGGCDSQHTLPFKSPEDVKAEAAEAMRIFKPGGGYVFNNIHNIQGGVPAENIVALFDGAYENSWY